MKDTSLYRNMYKRPENNYKYSNKELDNCTFVKVLLMLLVVIYHSCVFWHGDWFTEATIVQPSKFFQVIPSWLNSFHIWGFTLVSGFIFSYLQSIKHYNNIYDLAKKKFRRLIIPYFFICTVWVIPITQYFDHYPISTLITKYLLGTSPSQLWFLLMLFDLFIIAWLSENIFKKNNTTAIVVGTLSYCISIVGAHFLQNYFQIWTAFQYVPVFILGYSLFSKNKILKPAPWIVLHTTTFALLNVIPEQGMLSKFIVVCLTFINHICGAMMAFTVLQWIAMRINYQDSKIYKVLSKYSMTIYLFHQQIIYFVIYYLNILHVNVLIIAIGNFFISLTISLLLSFILSKWKVTKFLIGELT